MKLSQFIERYFGEKLPDYQKRLIDSKKRPILRKGRA
jgi:hypothetical protein